MSPVYLLQNTKKRDDSLLSVVLCPFSVAIVRKTLICCFPFLLSISPLYPSAYSFDDTIDCFTITFSDGHQRTLPRLIKAPFQYGKYAVDYVRKAQQYTRRPLKQAVISPSALSNVYPCATIPGYSREQFLDDLVNEVEKDICLCLEAGVEKVQMDFTEARLSLKIDPSGQLLKRFVQLNNRVLDRFNGNLEHSKKLGVHVCPGKK